MLQETWFGGGKDAFQDYIFSSREWSAPYMVSAEELRQRLDGFQLCGRKITGIEMVGMSYSHTRDWVEECAYNRLKDVPEEERQSRSNYNAIAPDMLFDRFAEIDEPILLLFEDGDVFEIDVPQEAVFRTSMNCIPLGIKAGINRANVNANVLFSCCLGQTIVSVEVNTYVTDMDPMFRCAFDEPPYQRELISHVSLRLKNGLELRMGACIDYCELECVDAAGETVTLPFSELKEALFNLEDLYLDENLGFAGQSGMLYFGSKGRSAAGAPFATITPVGKESLRAYISEDNTIALGWCIAHRTGRQFDLYEDYKFERDEWLSILEEGKRLFSFKSFDLLFDEVVDWNIRAYDGTNALLYTLNRIGTGIWRQKEWYRKQMEDLYEWSLLALGESESMNVYGF